MASTAALRISAGKKPPHWLSPMPPVRGERAQAVIRLCPEMGEPRERAHGHDEDIVGAEGIRAGWDRLQQQIRGEGAAARIFPVHVFGHGLDEDGPASQIDVMDGGGECQVVISFVAGRVMAPAVSRRAPPVEPCQPWRYQ